MATIDDFLPTTVWIWSLNTGTAVAVLIHHSPVRHIKWHMTETDLLLVHCAIPEASIHLWKSSWEAPRIIDLPLEKANHKLEASWLLSQDASQFQVLLSSTSRHITALLSSSGDLIPKAPELNENFDRSIGTGAEDIFDEGNSLDLSPIKITHDETEVLDKLEDGIDDSRTGFGLGNEMVDDTFHYRRHIRAGG